MDSGRIRKAWERFQERLRSLRERQKEILGRFIRRAEEEKIRKIREQMNDDLK